MGKGFQSTYYILSVVFGFIVGMHLASTWLVVLSIVFLVLAFTGYVFFRKAYFVLLSLMGVFVLVGNFYHNSLYTNELRHFRMRKDVPLVLRLDSVVEKPKTDTIYGYARVLSAPKKFASVIDQKVYFIFDTDKAGICPGQQIKVSCKLTHIRSDTYGEFSKFLFKNHIFWYCCDARKLDVLTAAPRFQKICASFREKIFATLEYGISDKEQSGALTGMLTGAKYKIAKSQRSDFCAAGVAHVFAVSGLHIGLIALCLDKIFRILLIPRKIRAFPVISILFLYINIIGPAPSAMRACLMVMFYYAAGIFNRQPNVLSAFANSSIIHILCCPIIVYNISFLLSYCVVFGIIMLAEPMNKIVRNLFINNKLRNIRDLRILQKIYFSFEQYFWAGFCSSFAACVASLIISLEFFGQISWLTMLFNVVIIPLASISIILGSLSIIFGLIHLVPICELINKLAILPIALIEKCFDLTREIDHGAINFEFPVHGLWLPMLLIIAYVGYFSNLYAKRKSVQSPAFCSANSFILRS